MPRRRHDCRIQSPRTHEAVAEAAQLTRAAASLSFPTLDYDPIRRARHWDLQQLLLWHARRALDDFWGPADEQGDPLFAVAAADYFRAAQAIGEVEPALLIERNRLAQAARTAAQRVAGGRARGRLRRAAAQGKREHA